MNNTKKPSFSRGFTLIELLVAISVIAVIIGLALPNFLGIRERARDSKRKSELGELKLALRLYYNDYQKYPGWAGSGAIIVGCGTTGTANCPVCGSAEFAAGGTDGCANIYMRRLPIIGTTAQFLYYQAASGNDFRLKVALENASDSDIAASQSRCPTVVPTGGSSAISYGTTDYILCAD